MFYRYNFADLDRIELEPYTYYTLEELTAVVDLTPFETLDEVMENWGDFQWFVYNPDKFSSDPCNCKSIEEAYEFLFEAQNNSLYERYHDL